MKNITIENIPDELHQQLYIMAQKHHRSLSQEIVVCLQNMVPHESDENIIDEKLKSIARLREETDLYVTEDDVQNFKRQGRP